MKNLKSFSMKKIAMLDEATKDETLSIDIFYQKKKILF